MVYTVFGFNGDQANRLICQEWHQPLAGQPLAQDYLAASILTVQKEHTLGGSIPIFCLLLIASPPRGPSSVVAIFPSLLPRGKRASPSHQFWQ